MRVLGKVTKITRDGSLVVKARKAPRLNLNVYDSRANLIGVIYDIVGPVKSPFIIVKLTSTRIKDPSYLQGRVLYVEEAKGRRGGRKR